MRRPTPTGVLAGGAAAALALRRGQLSWGATAAELRTALPGDELLPGADLVATRAITIEAPPERIWPWIVQLGQDRAGFYSYDWLENLAGCDIHSADGIVESWQDLRAGDRVWLHPKLVLEVASVDPARSLVLGSGPPPDQAASPPYDFSWSFVLVTQQQRTRLIVRERYRYTHRWSPALAEPVTQASFVMTQKMLRGIRDRVEQGEAAALLAALPRPGLYLYWIPLGTGAHVVRASGCIYERLVSLARRRRPQRLFHSALVAVTAQEPTVIEMTPVPDDRGHDRGVVCEGAVGSRVLGWLRVFRYEVRCWPGGVIPDLFHAEASPVLLTSDADVVQRLLDLAPELPAPVWGRDQIGAGEMWNSNSVTSWLLARTGVLDSTVRPPMGGRAPGWDAGVNAAWST